MSEFKISVLVPSYNCGEWIERCLESVAMQTVRPDRVLIIDDASTDLDYSTLALDLAIQHGFAFHRNEHNFKCPYNIWMGVKMLDVAAQDVIFLLDGDDFLPNEKVLERFEEIYSDPDVWLTYGNYKPYPYDTGQTLASAYDKQCIEHRDFRTAGQKFNHPITFRKFLFDKILEEDLQKKDGQWFTGGYDYAIMVPMLEMCGGEHYRFVNETLYYYNAVNPISDSIVNKELVWETEELLYRPKKEKL